MKNIIFIFAFMFISSFAFALSNENVKTGDKTSSINYSEDKKMDEKVCVTYQVITWRYRGHLYIYERCVQWDYRDEPSYA